MCSVWHEASGSGCDNLNRSAGRVKMPALQAQALPLGAMSIRLGDGLEAGRNRCQFLFALPITVAVGSLGGYEVAG